MSPVAGIVLAGGRSLRMGHPKADLDWHGRPLVAHVAGVLANALDGPIVVVRAPGQVLPPLPDAVEVAEDEPPGVGPLAGIAAGLRAVGPRAEAAYVSATDTPFLAAAFVLLVCSALVEEVDAAVPVVGARMHPLAAAYRTSVLPVVERLLAEERMRARDLFDEISVRQLTESELRLVEPRLDSLRNLNTPEEYAAARRGGTHGSATDPLPDS